MIRSFGDNICICDITILIGLEQYWKKVRIQKEIPMKFYVLSLYKGRELTLNGFKNWIFPIKLMQGKGRKILTPKKMLQRLPIALAQVKAGNTSGNLLNEIRKIIYSLCQAKLITIAMYIIKNVYVYNHMLRSKWIP